MCLLADSSQASPEIREVPCVDGSELARTFFTPAGWSVQAMDFQSGMTLPPSLFEAFKHPLVSPLISPITRFFVSFPAVFLCGFRPGLTTGFLRNFTRNIIREIVVDRV